jgi:hypothetical protein
VVHLGVLDDPSLVSPSLAPILAAMRADPRTAYQHAARAAVKALEQGTLAGIQCSSARFWITLRCPQARAAPAPSGAIFQCLARTDPPQSEADLVGWIVAQDDYHAGALVLVHELSHFLNRWVVWNLYRREATLVDRSIEPRGLASMVRARWLDEVAARHLAFLAEEGRHPGRTAMPALGALTACAVKIASYPDVYGDSELMPRLLARGDRDLLRDQVGAWLQDLRHFRFFDPGTEPAVAHAAWLDLELKMAARGRSGPEVSPEGTL